jgi:hypothetical protein
MRLSFERITRDPKAITKGTNEEHKKHIKRLEKNRRTK